MLGSNCECLVCRLEKSLLAEVRDAGTLEEYQLLTASSDALSAFPAAVGLIQHLHAPDRPHHSSSADTLVLELLKQNSTDRLRSICQRLLLLVFIPTIHRTTSQIAATFASLARDDIAQHIVSVFLEFLRSTELQTRRSHLAFTVARKLRRSAFRWAIHESRGAMPEALGDNSIASTRELAAEESLPAEILLHQFLDSCQEHGWLSREERYLLVQFKIEGVSCSELARQNGHSAVAIQHRIQRLLDRLRRLAQSTRQTIPEQLELFPP